MQEEGKRLSTKARVLLTILIVTALIIMTGLASPGLFIGYLILIGLTQLFYVVPLLFILWKEHRTAALGVLIGAAVIFLLNSLCWGMFIFSF